MGWRREWRWLGKSRSKSRRRTRWMSSRTLDSKTTHFNFWCVYEMNMQWNLLKNTPFAQTSHFFSPSLSVLDSLSILLSLVYFCIWTCVCVLYMLGCASVLLDTRKRADSDRKLDFAWIKASSCKCLLGGSFGQNCFRFIINFEPVVLNTIRETSILLFLDIGVMAHAFLFVGSCDRL